MERRDEFKCPCCGENMIDPRVEGLHKSMEEEIGEKIKVNSGYRCPKHNEEVGGSETSSHLKGLAWDVDCDLSNPRYRILRAAILSGISRIGIGKGYLHLDIDRSKEPTRCIWLY